MRLARELHKSIEEVEQFSGTEIDEWRLYFQTEPFLPDLLDFIGAHICQAVVAAAGGKHKRLEKFLLLKRDRGKQSPEAMEAAFRAAIG